MTTLLSGELLRLFFDFANTPFVIVDVGMVCCLFSAFVFWHGMLSIFGFCFLFLLARMVSPMEPLRTDAALRALA